MNNARLYQLSMAVVGGFFGIIGLYNLLEGNIYMTTVYSLSLASGWS